MSLVRFLIHLTRGASVTWKVVRNLAAQALAQTCPMKSCVNQGLGWPQEPLDKGPQVVLSPLPTPSKNLTNSRM